MCLGSRERLNSEARQNTQVRENTRVLEDSQECETPEPGDLIITDEALSEASLGKLNKRALAGVKIVRIGVDVRIPGDEAHLIRIIDAAELGGEHPVFVFAGICGGAGTTTALARATERALKRSNSVLVLDLVDDPTLLVLLSETTSPVTALSWGEVSISEDVVASRLPQGIVAVMGTRTGEPPSAIETLPLVRALRRAGPVLIDAGKWGRKTADFAAKLAATPVLIGEGVATSVQARAAKQWLEEFDLGARATFVARGRRGRKQLEALCDHD